MDDVQGQRRPLKVRQKQWSGQFAHWLAQREISPNQISLGSILFALLGAGAFLASGVLDGGWRWLCLLLAAAMIQGRLLCNLFDGMVAVEGGKSTPAGELFNDVPDRVSDALLLVALGYSLPGFDSAPWLGWLGALLAVLTAYVRVLGSSLGVPADFRGPMAKQHRMALMTIACVVSVFDSTWAAPGMALWLTLWVVAVGSAVTCGRRLMGIHHALSRGEA
ncbi:CDP-alcohol phosphatidyltransferase family protein [Marinobacter sp. M1N3S26]|uniref:CDP-alcohol phosphatidyltransferase family protein n=1 Tax=unclassified Marinobacter TaxID=83889 RepID=UPI00387AC629